MDLFTSIQIPFVPCTRNPNEYGRGKLVSCCSNIVSPFEHLIMVVTTSPSLNSTDAFGCFSPPFFTTYSCRPLALEEKQFKDKNRLPRLILIISAMGPMPCVGYKSPLR